MTIFFFQLPIGVCQEQEYYLQLFDHTHGLKPGNIVNLTRDQKGFIWVLYPHSVQKFDGQKCITFKPGGKLEEIFSDSQGRIWLSSYENVFLYNEDERAFNQIHSHTPDEKLGGKVFEDVYGKIWLLTTKDFYVFDEAQHIFIKHNLPFPVQPPYNARTFGQIDSFLFIAHQGFIYRVNPLTSSSDSLPEQDVRFLYPFTKDSVLVNTWTMESYWYDFSRGTVTPAHLPGALQDNYSNDINIRSAVQIAPSTFLISSREGIFYYDLFEKKFKNVQLYHHGNPKQVKEFTSTLYLDYEGYVWIGMLDGIGRFPLKAQSFGLKRIGKGQVDLPSGIDDIRCIIEGDEENLWLATANGFVQWNMLSKKSEIYLARKGSDEMLSFPSIRGIAYDGKNVILGPTDGGIWIYDPTKKKYRRPVYATGEAKEYIIHDFIDSFCKLADNKLLVLGRRKIYVLDLSDYSLSIQTVLPQDENSNFAFQRKDGKVWLTTTSSLHLLNDHLQLLRTIPLQMKNPLVQAGVILRDQRFLFSTQDGLFVITEKEGNFIVSKFTELLDNVFITTLLETPDGHIWAASEDGMYRFQPATSRLDLFDVRNNVQGYSFNYNSWCRASDGTIYIGGTNGLNYFHPERISRTGDSLIFFIQGARSEDDQEWFHHFEHEMMVRYPDQSVQVELAYPYFNSHDNIKFRYKLQDEDDWNYLHHVNVLQFPSLDPGKYHFTIEASVNQVDWIPSQNQLQFRVTPPFWKSAWFYLFCLSIVIGLPVWYIHKRNKILEHKKEELEAEKAINYFSSRMAQRVSENDLLWEVAENCIGRLHFEDCVIYRLDEEGQHLVQVAAYGPKANRWEKINNPIMIPLGKGISGSVAFSKQGEIIPDTSKDERYIVDDQVRLSEITVPILYEGKVLGIIDCEHSKKNFFTKRHMSILTTLASLCAAQLVRIRVEEEKKETERQLLITQKQMVNLEMEALKARMNPHFIFNCLNSINRYIVKSDQATASLYLTRFAKLIRLILDLSYAKSVSLFTELEALSLYIEMESIRFEKQFTYTLHIDEHLNLDHILVPPLIIQPFVENAIWHGLLHKNEAGHLSLTIQKNGSATLECTIEDNGVGRERAKELRNHSIPSRKSMGMKITEERLALLNKTHGLESTFSVYDLVDADGQAAGTRVVLKIPIDG